MKKLIIILLISFFLCSCGKSTFQEATTGLPNNSNNDNAPFNSGEQPVSPNNNNDISILTNDSIPQPLNGPPPSEGGPDITKDKLCFKQSDGTSACGVAWDPCTGNNAKNCKPEEEKPETDQQRWNSSWHAAGERKPQQ